MNNEFFRVEREVGYRLRNLHGLRSKIIKELSPLGLTGEMIDLLAGVEHELDMIEFSFKEARKDYDRDYESTLRQDL